jgi:hypothetical protein
MKIQVFRDVIFARSTAPSFSQSSSPRILLDPEDVGTMQTQCQLQGEYVHKYIYNTNNPQKYYQKYPIFNKLVHKM